MRTHDGRDHIRLTFVVDGVSSACQFRGPSRREEAPLRPIGIVGGFASLRQLRCAFALFERLAQAPVFLLHDSAAFTS
jgi:hypothetical protein